jgi:ion channel-forming bestrophin family protein
MAMPTPDPGIWVFSEENDLLFANSDQDERISPDEWVRRGVPKMRDSLTVL